MIYILFRLLFALVFLVPQICFAVSQTAPQFAETIEKLKELKPDNIELSPMLIDDGQIKIEGYATNTRLISNYLRSIEASKIGVVQVNEIMPAESNGRHSTHFKISIVPAPTNILAPHELNPEQQKILAAWLKKHKNLRLAENSDCDCNQGIQEMRDGQAVGVPVPEYNPYCVAGDFNGDGNVDFAVALVDNTKKESGLANYFELAVFNGPFTGKIKTPVFVETDINLTSQGMFFGFPYSKPYRLLVGPFRSEGALLIPNKRSYKWDDGDF